ncbi:MAG: hypothetical protein COT74_12910 [Bdellovibrionales bacterium CG10_big_fil_rev_8_21_14_0_10_45_34]|nr:MAG: hypothetical protein COT74_12910 [Bdellovibrionales bacterium CG10_big_fil_rev_8_21_14_0_10_45_34]
MILRLNEIKSEGEDFEWTETETSLTDNLKDVLGSNSFVATAHIMPSGSAYDVHGAIRSQCDLTCGRCLKSYKMPLDLKFHEILLLSETKNKTMIRGTPEDFEDVGALHIKSLNFDIGEMYREFIILEQPPYPVCSESCQGLCPKCGQDLNEKKCDCLGAGLAKDTVFSVLKNVKLN